MSDDRSNILLNAFVLDFEERIGQEQAISLSRCLRRIYSSKQRPLKVVQGLLLGKVTAEQLEEAHGILVAEHLPTLSQASGSTMPCIQQVSVVVGFVQLLLESSPEHNPMVMTLLQGLTKSVAALLQSNRTATTGRDEDDDDDDRIPTDRLDARILGSFVVAALLRTVNPYIVTVPFLLSPLWKGICDVVSQQDTMPQELAKESLMALLSYLEEGERQCTLSLVDFLNQRTEQNSLHNIQHHFFHIKVLSFLMARLTVLLPLYLKTIETVEEDQSSTLDQVCLLVCRIRGLGLVAAIQFYKPHPQDEDVIRQYKQLELKAEQCSQKAMARGSVFVKQLLVSSTNISGELRSLSPGKLLTWHQCLQVPSFDDPELRLLVCQEMIFSTIPKCFEFMTPHKTSNQFHALLSTSIHLISDVLVQSPYRERKLHGVLLKWLASAKRMHPASREVLLASIHQSCIMTTKVESPRAVHRTPPATTNQPLMATLSSLLLDPRSRPLHRSNIAGLLIRMLVSSGPCQSAAQSAVAEEFATCIKRHTATMKRKRKEGGAATSYSFGQFGVDDIVSICSVLQCLDEWENSYLRESFEGLSRDLCQGELDGDCGAFWIGKRQPVEVALLLAYLAGILDGERGGMQVLQQICGGVGSDRFLLRISQWFVQSAKRRTSGTLTKGMVNAVLSTLCLLRSGLSHTGGRSTPPELLNSVVDSLTMCSQLVGKLMCSSQRQAMMLVVELVAILGKFGSVVHSNSPTEIVQTLASTFKNLFLLNLWPVSSESMTSLTSFASTLPATHQGILPKCFPLEMQAFLKARLQGIVHRKPKAHKDEDFVDVHYACSKTLNKVVPKKLPATLFSTTSETVMEAGSLILSMPTNGGRTALVVFAPSEQSIEDIKYMLGTDSIENVGVQTLQRVKLLAPGGAHGCRLFSKSFQL
jgi:hypothetical protein